MTKYHLLYSALIVFVMTFSQNAHSQNSTTPFVHSKAFDEKDAEKLFFRFENFNFIKNNEYESNYVEGATWIGYTATPKLVYYPSSKIKLEAGARFQKFSGETDYNEVEPVFSATYKASDRFEITLGTLNQDNNHNLSEALFNSERFFMNKAENGLQYRYHSPKLHIDTWINWEQFIMDDDPFQERFTFGTTAKWQINSIEQKNPLSIPFEAIITHRGGEIDSSEDNVQTLQNIGLGLEYVKKIENRKLKSWTLKYMFYTFNDDSSNKEFTYESGTAHYPQIEFRTKKSSLALGYWNGYKFVASRGNEIFQSVSIDNPELSQKRRQLATLNYYYDNQISKGIHLGGKVDVYHDLYNSKTDYIAAIYLRITGDFFLKKVKWN